MTEAQLAVTIHAAKSKSLGRCDQQRHWPPPPPHLCSRLTSRTRFRRWISHETAELRETSGAGSFQPAFLQQTGRSGQVLLSWGWLQSPSVAVLSNMFHLANVTEDIFSSLCWCAKLQHISAWCYQKPTWIITESVKGLINGGGLKMRDLCSSCDDSAVTGTLLWLFKKCISSCYPAWLSRAAVQLALICRVW